MRRRSDVERLVTWALADQGLGWQRPGPPGAGTMAGLAELGMRVDVSGGGLPAPSPALMTDDDAAVVWRVIQAALDAEAARLVVEHGRAGVRPDWCAEGVGRPVQMRDKRGRPQWIWEKPGDHRSKRWAVMEWIGWSPQQVEAKRRLYARWHGALAALVAPLNDSLARWEATGPAAPAAPWELREAVIHSDDGTVVSLAKARESGVLRAADRRRWIEPDDEGA